MKVSQAGILVIIAFLLVGLTGCNFFARKDVVDGAEAFKGRKFDEAEKLFRRAISRAPADSVEGKTARLFLARTLHSQFAGNRIQTPKAEEAIAEYKKVLEKDPKDNSSFKAVANLLENLGKMDEWKTWVTERSENTNIPPEQRAEAYTSLAAKENTCANEITEDPAVKKTVEKDGKAQFTFSKPTDTAKLDELKGCIQRGTDLINKALALETEEVKNAKSVDVKSMDDKALRVKNDALKPFESARSYHTSLLVQSARLAEMEGRTPDKDRFTQEKDAAKEKFKELADVTKAIKDEQEARQKAKEEESNTAKAANTSGNQ
jgi:tetratricopeptide (TPR) repeat protein